MFDKLRDFRETLHERLKSPFIGSFMIAWAIIHWKIFILFFYVQENITIEDRVGKISNYLESKSTWDLIWYPVLITLLVLIGYSILNSIGLFIRLLYDNWASPYIQRFVYNKNIIEKAKYEKLKSQYTVVQRDYENDKEAFINTEKNFRDIKISFENFQARSFEGKFESDITKVFGKDILWENIHTYSDGRTGYEVFKCDIDGLTLLNGTKMKISNIKQTTDGRILSFDKIIGEKVLNNRLIQDARGDYFGVEDYNIFVNYRKQRQTNIIIKSAKYGSGDIYFDVKNKLSQLVAERQEIKATNEIWGDPKRGAPKFLEINYTINGVERTVIINEGESIKIEY